MIVRITFDKDLTMMFGDSYKPWTMQFDEFSWTYKNELREIKSVEVSSSKWVGWGGLKWCPEEDFQKQLNREGCQSGDPDNPKPRQYKDMSFCFDSKADKITRLIFEDCKNNRHNPKLVNGGKIPKGA